MRFEENDYVELKVSFTGREMYFDDRVHTLPTGKRGTVVSAFEGVSEVEFCLNPDEPDEDYDFCVILIDNGFLELVSH